MERKKILVIDDDMESCTLLETLLTVEGYDVIFAYDGKTGLEKTRCQKPDLVLLDIDLPDVDGLVVCRNLKADPITRFIPVIVLSGTRKQIPDKLTGLKIGADVYLFKPFNHDELKVEIERSLRRTSEHLSASPLTRLPGSLSIEQEIVSRINSGEKFAVCYFDIDHFKPYNDYYGFHRGDKVIQFLAQTIVDSSNNKGDKHDFMGHIGGDDFILITVPEKIEIICSDIVETFDREIINYYNDDDVQRGYITTRDRLNELHKFPVMTLSVSIVTNEKRIIEHYGRIVDILVEMKRYAKSIKERKGSIYVKDRRADRVMVPAVTS